MTTQLLATKLFIPPLRSEFVSRPALVKRINAGLDGKLTLISAPAGFGKSTLLSEWTRVSQRNIAWVSLNEEDNNVHRFWSYFIAGITKIYAEIGGLLIARIQSQQPPGTQEILTALINEMVNANPHPFAMVLDDFHLIDSPEIHEGITFLIENSTPVLHLLIATRSDPLLPLGRWRGRGELNELRTNDLRFTLLEAIEFFNDTMGLDIHRQDIEALKRRTEGWITGLTIAAISIKGRIQNQNSAGLAEFIATFTGSHRFVLDYLVEEVIKHQQPKIKDFLLRTSILDRLTAPLCQAVTGNIDSQDILEYLYRTNLFLIPLDEDLNWYRYHHLFRELLHNLLEREYASQVSALHSKASDWFETYGLLTEAVKHALAMGSVERFARLIAGNAVNLIYLGELQTIEHWLSMLPSETMYSSPWLCIANAWVKAYLGEHHEALSLLDDTGKIVEHPTKSNQLDDVEKSEIFAHIGLIRGFLGYFSGDVEQSAIQLRQAFENIPTRDNTLRCYATGLFGAILKVKGDLHEAENLIEESIRLSRETGLEQLIADSITDLMSLRIAQGRYRDAAAAGFDALELDKEYFNQFGKHLLTMGRVHYYLSNIYLNWNEVDKALEHIEKGLETAQKWGKADEIATFYSGMAWVLLAQGNAKGALDVMKKAKQIAREISPMWETYGNLAEARLHLHLGNVGEAVRLSQGYDFQLDHPIAYVDRSEYLLFARLLSAQEKHYDARALLDRLKGAVESVGAMGDLIPILVTQAMVFQKMRQHADALDILAYALAIAEPEKSMRVFIDAGTEIVDLLQRFKIGDETYHFAMQLLAAIDEQAKDHRLPGLHDSLSERELEVLQLLTTPATHAEIAEHLHISRNTVRSHIKRIYSKLGVNKRIQAIEKARKVGLMA